MFQRVNAKRWGGGLSDSGLYGRDMWELLEAAYPRRDDDIGDRLRRIDNDIDDLHVSPMACVIDAELPVPVAINVALVGRYIERLGDHAVMVASKVGTLTIGVPGVRVAKQWVPRGPEPSPPLLACFEPNLIERGMGVHTATCSRNIHLTS